MCVMISSQDMVDRSWTLERSGLITEPGAGEGMVPLGITGNSDTTSCGDGSCVADGVGVGPCLAE